MKIIGVHLQANSKSGKSGINCLSTHLKELGTLFKIDIDGKPYYFKLTNVLITDGSDDASISYRLEEYGYYNKISKNKFNLRSLIGKELTQVDDNVEIAKLNQEACYC